jgi:hypothetical protein
MSEQPIITSAQIQKAVEDAERQLRIVRHNLKPMAHLLAGNIRTAMSSPDFYERRTLAKLKRELQGFNITTGTWRE